MYLDKLMEIFKLPKLNPQNLWNSVLPTIRVKQNSSSGMCISSSRWIKSNSCSKWPFYVQSVLALMKIAFAQNFTQVVWGADEFSLNKLKGGRREKHFRNWTFCLYLTIVYFSFYCLSKWLRSRTKDHYTQETKNRQMNQGKAQSFFRENKSKKWSAF